MKAIKPRTDLAKWILAKIAGNPTIFAGSDYRSTTKTPPAAQQKTEAQS